MKPKESRSKAKQQSIDAASQIMLARMLSKMLAPDDPSGDVSISDKLDSFIRIADEHLHQTAGGIQSMSEPEVQEAMQEMGYDQTVVKEVVEPLVVPMHGPGWCAMATGDSCSHWRLSQSS